MKSGLLITLVALFVHSFAGCSANIVPKHAYDKLNNILEQRETSDDLNANIKVAKELLNGPSDDPELVELASHVVALQKVQGNRCSIDSIKLVSDAFDAMEKFVRGRLRDDRLGRLIDQVRVSCLDELAPIYSDIDHTPTAIVKNLREFTLYLNSDYCSNKDELVDRVSCTLDMQDSNLDWRAEPENVYRGLQAIHRWRAKIGSVSDVRRLLNWDLSATCKEFLSNEKLIPIIEAATSNLSTFKYSSGIEVTKNPMTEKLLRGVANYVTCERVRITNMDKLAESVFMYWEENERHK